MKDSHMEGFGMIWGKQQLGLAGLWAISISSKSSGSRLKRVCHVLRPIVLVIQGPWATMERLDRGWKIIVQATYVWLG